MRHSESKKGPELEASHAFPSGPRAGQEQQKGQSGRWWGKLPRALPVGGCSAVEEASTITDDAALPPATGDLQTAAEGGLQEPPLYLVLP